MTMIPGIARMGPGRNEGGRMSSEKYDVISLGSTMLRLSVPPGERLETAPVYEVRTAGTESNSLVALARIGRRTAWVSRLVDNGLGRRVASEIRSHGVDVDHIRWTDTGRNEVFFVEYGADPRPTSVIYDRHPSSVAEIDPAELDLDFLVSGRVLHLTGIFPALSENCRSAMERVIEQARQAGTPVSFDLNYRAKLWPPERAKAVLEPFLEKADLIVITREDALGVLGLAGTAVEMGLQCLDRYSPSLAVITLPDGGAVGVDGRTTYQSSGHLVEIRDRLGAGDAFTAGLIHGWLDGDIQKGLDYGSAMAALKLSIHGDYFVSTLDEVKKLVEPMTGRQVER